MNGAELQRLASVETEVKNIKGEIISIKENHLPSIYKRLNAANVKLIAILSSLVVGLIIAGAHLIIKIQTMQSVIKQ